MQLDLFGFPIEEKPVKKQEKKAAAEKTPAKQEEAPVQTKAFDPVTQEYTEVNIHAIPGLKQITILDAVAVVDTPVTNVTATTVQEDSGQSAAETVSTSLVTPEEKQHVEDIPATKEEELITEEEVFTAETTTPADEIPVDVLEAMAEEMAVLERSLEEQVVIAEAPPVIAEEPVLMEDEAVTETQAEEPLAEQAAMEETAPPVAEIPVLTEIVEEETATEEPLAERQAIEEAAPSSTEIPVLTEIVEEETSNEEPLAEQVAIEEAEPPVTEIPVSATEATAETIQPGEQPADEPTVEDAPAETPTEELPAIEITPVAHEQGPGHIVIDDDPMLVLHVGDEADTDENVIEFNQTLFSRQSVEEMVSPAKKAALKAKGKRGRKSFKDIDAEIALVEVPDDEELFQKLYYPISQVAQWFNVNTSLLRFWENEFDILKPRKNRKGDRMFRPEDVKNLQVIYHLLRQRKFSIEGAKKYIKQNKSRAEINIQLIQSLTKFRSFLLEMKANLGA